MNFTSTPLNTVTIANYNTWTSSRLIKKSPSEFGYLLYFLCVSLVWISSIDNINTNIYHSLCLLCWVWNCCCSYYPRWISICLSLHHPKVTLDKFLKRVADRSWVLYRSLSIHDMLIQRKLLSLLSRNLSASLVSFVSYQADLHIHISFLPYVLQPIAHVLERRALSDVEHNDRSIHLSIIARS
jgi:hypothetical protein